MSDFKSKLPDFKELSSMTSKLYKGIKTSVEEIIKDYKEKRAAEEMQNSQPTPPEAPVAKPVPPVKTPSKPKETNKKVDEESDEIK